MAAGSYSYDITVLRVVSTEIQIALCHLETPCYITVKSAYYNFKKTDFSLALYFISMTYTVFEKYTIPVLCVVCSIHHSSRERQTTMCCFFKWSYALLLSCNRSRTVLTFIT